MIERLFVVDGMHVCLCERTPEPGGDAGCPPVLFLHGFTGSAKSWAPVWERLEGWEQGRALYAPDVVGHGRTDAPRSLDRYRMDAATKDLASLLDLLGAPRIDLVGYSMGGRLALQFAAACPSRVRKLVLESATPGIEDPIEREERRARDLELAEWIETHGMAAFVDRWESLPLFSSQEKLPPSVKEAQRKERLKNRPHALANSLRGMGTGAQRSLWKTLDAIEAECLLIAGEADEKFCAIARKMNALLPRSLVRLAPGVGHNVHLEDPDFFTEEVSKFLSCET